MHGSPSPHASPEELRYARVLDLGVKAGLALLAVSFIAYVAGILPPQVPFDELPKYWGLPVAEFVKATHTPTGWGWLVLLGKGDMLNLLPIAYLAGVSAICSLSVLPIFAERREWAHFSIAALQIVVLVLAASDVFGRAH